MAEGDNSRVNQLVRAGGGGPGRAGRPLPSGAGGQGVLCLPVAGEGLAAAGLCRCWGRRGSQACPRRLARAASPPPELVSRGGIPAAPAAAPERSLCGDRRVPWGLWWGWV